MGQRHIETAVQYLTSGAHCTEDIIDVLHAMWREGIGPAHDGIGRNDLEDELGVDLEYEPKTVLDDNAVQIGLVDQDPEDSEDLTSYIIAEWRPDDDGIVNGEVDDAATEAIDAIIDHMHATDPGSDTTAVADGGVTHRDVLSDAFGIDEPAAVEARLRRGDLVSNVNTAVEAIEDSDAVTTRNDYDEFSFRYEGYSYSLSNLAVELYQL